MKTHSKTNDTQFKANLIRCLQDRKGQGLTEYIALVVLIAVASLGVAKTLGNTVKGKIEEARSHIDSGISFSDGTSGK